ncbi:transporter substrate-binding domain-containing protein [Saccharothrix variisporea]|uniref:Polar amino acid transport system substrate-binding protein n=1 Tax=Saccharothrix variisporea TaxID=543527 RepID=A0A495X325_9PSEU|nr:transporter substrate-binding domain-containing protein [Saccharothrix variisporea]RKT67574.1 polar amino acid transport system substrate-binding protein [Saccharothrix variisporea]
MWRILLVAAVLLTGCGIPRDTDGTLDRVRGGVLRVGVAEHPPWTAVDGPDSVSGAEADLVTRLADELDARVEWHPGAESALMAALEGRQLDLVVGGLTDDLPWTEHAALSRPYATTRVVVAATDGVELPPDLDGRRVAARGGTAEAAALADEGAEVVPVGDPAEVRDLPVAVEHWRMDALGLRAAEHVLLERRHVWALPLGENGWLVEVERFLLELPDGEVDRLLERSRS